MTAAMLDRAASAASGSVIRHEKREFFCLQKKSMRGRERSRGG
jgi:hypothetical protein